MKANILMGALAVALACSCSEKKEAQTVAPVRVVTQTVGPATAGQGQPYTGTIEEESGSTLSFATAGTVQRIAVSEGQFVRQGQLVGVVDATQARESHAAARAAREQAADAQRRMKMLHDNGSLPDIKWVETQTQLSQARSAEQIAAKNLADTRLLAPFSGYITQKNVEAGANVGPGVPVVKLVRIDRVKVKISVPEEEVSRFKVGMTLPVKVAALGGRTFTTRVVEKNVEADALSRSYEVKGLIANPHHELLPGMIADVTAPAPTTAQTTAIALPADAIELETDNRTFVWTVQGGKAQKTYVTTGENLGSLVAITAGLNAGDVVITQGQQKVSTGMAVTNK